MKKKEISVGMRVKEFSSGKTAIITSLDNDKHIVWMISEQGNQIGFFDMVCFWQYFKEVLL